MRRLSMKSKHRKSETHSDGESDENGVVTSAAQGLDNEEDTSTHDNFETPKKTMKKRTTKRSRGKQTDESFENANENESTLIAEENQQANGTVAKGGGGGGGGGGGSAKRRKKEEQKASTSQGKTPNENDEYEVQKIVSYRTIKGRRQFLIRWKGYGEESDTWERETDLNCPELIEEFLAENSEDSNEKSIKTPKTKESKADKKSRRSKGDSKKNHDADDDKDSKNDEENSKEFEVEKIVEVHFKKNKNREFLIRWKGFTSADDTWEPEENLNCPDLIAKFMGKVEKAKETEMRELRTNPTHTKRYTLTTHEHGRRLSRRNMDKQRATYHECDE